MKNNDIKEKLVKYFQPGDVPTAVQFEEMINDALDLGVPNSIVETQIFNAEEPVNVVIDIPVPELNDLSSLKFDQYQLENGQLVLLVAQDDARQNGLYRYENAQLGDQINLDLNVEFKIGYAVKTENNDLWFIYRLEKIGDEKYTYWKKRLDLNADNILQGTLDNARLPDDIRFNNITVDGELTLEQNVNVKNNLTVSGNVSVAGNNTVTGTQTVTGESYADSNLTVAAGLAVGVNADITGNAAIGGNQTVTGDITATNFIGDGFQITKLDTEQLSGKIKNTQLDLITNDNKVNRKNLPDSSDSDKGIIKCATAEEAKDGSKNDVAITPATFSDAINLDDIFIIKEDIGLPIEDHNIPEGKILMLYTELNPDPAPQVVENTETTE